jgi:hypothetical protein
MAASKQNRDPNSLYLERGPGDDPAQLTAEAAMRPQVQAALTVRAYTQGTFRDLEVMALVDALSDQAKATGAGKLNQGEAMLTAQAHTLDAIFNSPARRALNTDFMDHFDRYPKLALRAQSQGRASWEALVTMKTLLCSATLGRRTSPTVPSR